MKTMKTWFKNLQVGKKMTVGFSILLVFMGLVGITGYVSMSMIELKLDNIFQIQLPSINYILEADRDLFQLIVAERTMMFTEPGSEQFVEFQAFYQENLMQSQQRWEKYKDLAKTEQEHTLFPLYEAARNEWNELSSKVISGRIQAQEWSTQRAIALSLGEANEKFEIMRGYLDQLTEMNQQMAADAHHNAQITYRVTLLIFLLLAAVGVMSGLGLALLIGNGITRPLAEAVETACLIADGDLSISIEAQTTDETGQLLGAMKHMVAILKNVVSEGESASGNVANGSQQLSSVATQISEGTNYQAASTEELSSSMEEMVSNINQNADNALQTEKIALQAAENAMVTQMTMKKVVKAMRKIAKEISVIEEISTQTRMLSLNATIEASKAQEYGKGFAVVASEVRELARRTQVAAQKISKLTSSGVAIVKKAGDSLESLVPDIHKTAELVQEISASSKEQSVGSRQINMALVQLDQITQQHSAASEEMAATAEQLAAQADQLQHTIAFFRTERKNASIAQPSDSPAGEDSENIHKDSQVVTPEKSLDGVALNIYDTAAKADKLDDEFEHY